MNQEQFEECWSILETIGRPQANRKPQWDRILRPLDFDRVRGFLLKWGKSSLPSPDDVVLGVRSGKIEVILVDCATCKGSGQVCALVVTPEGKRTEYGARCHCVAGRKYGALPTVDQLRPKGGQVITNPTLAQRRETGPVVVMEKLF